MCFVFLTRCLGQLTRPSTNLVTNPTARLWLPIKARAKFGLELEIELEILGRSKPLSQANPLGYEFWFFDHVVFGILWVPVFTAGKSILIYWVMELLVW